MKKIVVFLLLICCLSLVSCDVINGGLTGGGGQAHNVEFVSNEGTDVSPQKISKLEAAPKTARESYFFCGWFLDKELKNPVVYPMDIEKDTVLYAKWTKETEVVKCDDAAVQFSVNNEHSYKAEYLIEPKEIDVQALAAQGYYVKIDVTYEVYYERDDKIPLYMGAPDHDVAIIDFYDKGEIRSDLPTETEPQSESISTLVSAAGILNTLYLKFSTHNLQNVVYFKNIEITYTCQASR